LSHRKQPPSVTTPINVAMPTSIAGTNQCNKKPTPRPIAIQTAILTNTIIRNRNREYTAFSLPLAPHRPLSHRPVMQPAAHNDDGGRLLQAGRSPRRFQGAGQLGGGGNP